MGEPRQLVLSFSDVTQTVKQTVAACWTNWCVWWWSNLVFDEGPSVRRYAVYRLGALQHPRAVRALLAGLEHDPELYPEVVEALVCHGVQDMPATVAAVLELEGEEGARDQVTRLVAGGDRGMTALFISRLADSDPVHVERAQAVLEAAGNHAVEPLLQQLLVADARRRKHASAVLHRLGEGELTEALTAAIEGEPEAQIVLGSLIRQGKRHALETLNRALCHPDPLARAAACVALGAAGRTDTAVRLLAQLKDPVPAVQAAACHGLGLLGRPSAVPALSSAATSKVDDVRRQAVAALGKIGTATAVEVLIRHLWDRDAAVRKRALQGVCAAGDLGVRILIHHLRIAGQSAKTQVDLIGVLGSVGTPRAVRALVEFLSSPHNEVRAAALQASRSAGHAELAETFEAVVGGSTDAVDRLEDLLSRGEVQLLTPLGRLFDWGTHEERARLGASLAQVAPLATERLMAASANAAYSQRVALPGIFAALARAAKPDLDHLLCTRCLCRLEIAQHRGEPVAAQRLACRSCDRTDRVIRDIRHVVVVLDTMDRTETLTGGIARGNWFERREPFDFDQVEIRHATDYEVERFCVKVGNDLDPFRRQRYPRLPCTLFPECVLEENTKRLLRETFGEVRQVAV